MDGALSQYRPLRWELVGTTAQRREWRQLLERHHYLGAPPLVGANLKYLVYGRTGQLLGALGWQSAVQHLGCRDRLLGWNAAQRARWLDHVVNGVRFLVLPWVRVRDLASVILSENLALLQRDWPGHYGVPVWLAESFVDRQRFSGASYRAANWQAIGWTRGFAKRQGRFVRHGQSKEVYVYVMEPRMRQFIHGDGCQPLLSRAFLLARRRSEEKQSLTKRMRMKKILTSWKPRLPSQCELSVEDVERVVGELKEFTGLFGPTFGRSEPAALCELYLQGLLSDAERKNVEAIALKLDGPERTPESERWLLLRNDANCEIKYALSNAPQQTPMRELVRVSGARWPVERCFQEDKSELGLDHYEHRSWTAWHRHMRLVCLAQLFLLRLQVKFKKSSRLDVAASTPAD